MASNYVSGKDRGFHIWESPVTASHQKFNQEFIREGGATRKTILERFENPYVKWHEPLGLFYNRLYNSGHMEVVILAVSSTVIDGSPLMLCGRWMTAKEWYGIRADWEKTQA